MQKSRTANASCMYPTILNGLAKIIPMLCVGLQRQQRAMVFFMMLSCLQDTIFLFYWRELHRTSTRL